MSNYTMLDCVIGSAGLMRQAVAQAIHHASHRTAFNKRLLDHGLMANVLADLAIESEAATVLAMRLALRHHRHTPIARHGHPGQLPLFPSAIHRDAIALAAFHPRYSPRAPEA
jgi:alkylation response protein AidB-like acyl-CoA dehydrogenase